MSDTPIAPGLPAAAAIEAPPAPFSAVFRTSQPRATNAIAGLAVLLVVAGLSIAHQFSGFELLERAERGQLTLAEGEAFDGTSITVAFIYGVAALAAGIAFLAWLSRAIDNTPVLRAGVPSVTPRWSIGWWFIPIANFWKPYRIVRDLAVRMAGADHPGGQLVDAWWAVWILGGVVFGLASRLQARDTIDGLRNSLISGIGGELANIIALVLGILVVRHIQRHADLRAKDLVTVGPATAPPPPEDGASHA